MPDEAPDITEMLGQWNAGNPAALGDVISSLYNQLRALAERQMRRERPEHTLQATALVNELYLQLSRQPGARWKDRQHFFACAAMMMRRILIDHAKSSMSAKRGGSVERLPLSDAVPWLTNSNEEILSLAEALDALERFDARKARLVELRVLLGCTAAEAASILGVSKATADREWTLAKAWLFRRIRPERPAET